MRRSLICSALISLLAMLFAVAGWAQPWPTLPIPASSTMPSPLPAFMPPPFPRQPAFQPLSQPEIPLIPGAFVPGIGTLQPLSEAPGCLVIQPSPRWVRTGVGNTTQQMPVLPRPELQMVLFANPINGCPLPSHQPPVFDASGVLRTPSYQVFDQLLPAANPKQNQGAQGFRAVQRSTRASCWFGVNPTATLTCNRPFTPAARPPLNRGQISQPVLKSSP